MNSPLATLLQLLQDPQEPFPQLRLGELSDLSSDQVRLFQRSWPAIPLERRRSLIEAIGRLADEHIVLTFEAVNRHAINDQDPIIRRRAIENLWECQDPYLALSFISLLKSDPSPDVREAAASALGQFVYLSELDEIDGGLRAEIEAALLMAIEDDQDQSVRLRSLESLGFSSRREVQALIKRAHASADEQSRHSAILAMGRSADPGWAESIIPDLQAASPSLRAEAAHASGELELRQALPDLIDLLDDVDAAVRRQAIWALGQLGGPQARAALFEHLEAYGDDSGAIWVEEALDHIAFLESTDPLIGFDFDTLEEPPD